MATRDITVSFSDGTKHVYKNAPRELTPEDVMKRVATDFEGLEVTNLDGGNTSTAPSPAPEPKGEVKFWDEAKGPEQGLRLNPEQEGALREFYSTKPDTSAINDWWKQQGFGGLANAEEVSRTLRAGGNVEGVNYGAVDHPRTKEDIGNTVADMVLEDLGPQNTPTQAPAGAPVAKAGPVLGFWEGVGQRAKEAFSEAGESLSGLAKREAADARDEDNIRRWAQEQGFSPEESDAFVAQAYDRRSEAIREERAQRGRFWQDQDARSGRWGITNFARDVLGEIGGDPIGTFVPAGRGASVVKRMTATGGINTAIDAAVQGSDIYRDINDSFDLSRSAINFAAGAGLQGAMEGAAKLLTPRTKPSAQLEAEVAPPLTPEVTQGIRENLGLEVPQARGMEGEPAFPGEMGIEGQRAFEGPRFTPKEPTPPREVPTRKETKSPTPQQMKADLDRLKAEQIKTEETVLEAVTKATDDWTNRPDIKVHSDFKKLDVDQNALGFMDADTGEVHLNASLLAKEAKVRKVSVDEMATATVFHESLGHYGLAQKFQDDLNRQLIEWDNLSSFFRKQVDAWEAKHPNAYADDVNPRARAAEEVLAEMSEAGTIPTKLRDRILNTIRDIARDFGWKLKISENEMKVILAKVHEGVTKGTRQDIVPNVDNLRYSRTMGESEGPLRGSKNLEEGVTPPANRPAIETYRSNRNLDDILEEAAPTRTKESFDEWIDDSGSIKMNDKAIRDLSKGVKSPQILAAEDFALRSANRIADLSRISAERTLTPNERHLLQVESERLERVSQGIADAVADASRVLLSRKIVVGTDKALITRARRMVEGLDFNDPAAIKQAADDFVKGVKNDKEKAKAKAEIEKVLNIGTNILSMPRSIMSSLDLSAPLRQGVALIGRKEFWKSVPKMLKQATSEKAFQKSLREIKNRPTYEAMKKAGLAISDMGKDLSAREELFISEYAQRIPIFGAFVRSSERAYAGFLNNLRADTFDTLFKNGLKVGVDFKDPKALKDVADFINNATGRGDLGKFNDMAPKLNALFFSPRLIASRVNLLNPVYYAKLSPFARKEALKNMMTFGAIALTVLGIAKAGGADVESDPRSSDFGKIRLGDTRYDILGGFGQYITLGARIVSNEKKNARGEITPLKGGEKASPFADSRRDISENFLRNKFAPIPSFISDALHGSNAIGEEFEAFSSTEIGGKKVPTLGASVSERLAPLFIQDLKDMVDKKGFLKGTFMSLPAMFGVGIQDYAVEGTDRFGAVFDQDESLKNTTLETVVKGIEEATGESALGWPQKSLKIEGETVKLSQEDYDEYVKTAAHWIDAELEDVIKTPEWTEATPQQRLDMFRKISAGARRDARKALFLENEDFLNALYEERQANAEEPSNDEVL